MSRGRGRPRYSGRIYWPDVRKLLELGTPVWRLVALFDVDRHVIYNAFRRYGWDTQPVCVRKIRKKGCAT